MIRIIIVLLFINTIYLVADDQPDRWDLQLHQHSQDTNFLYKPALFMYTNPKDSNSSYQIDMALSVVYLPGNSDLEIKAGYEIHKNTLIEKTQDSESINIVASTYTNHSNCSDNICTDNVNSSVSINFVKDNTKHTESILTIFEATGINTKLHMNHITASFPFYWAPVIGLEYENIIESKDNKTGSLGRLYGHLEMGLYPFFNELKGRLLLSTSYSYWVDFNKDKKLQITDDRHILRNAKLSYDLTPKGNKIYGKDIDIILELSWVNGEDPRNKKEKQEYTQFGLGIKF